MSRSKVSARPLLYDELLQARDTLPRTPAFEGAPTLGALALTHRCHSALRTKSALGTFAIACRRCARRKLPEALRNQQWRSVVCVLHGIRLHSTDVASRSFGYGAYAPLERIWGPLEVGPFTSAQEMMDCDLYANISDSQHFAVVRAQHIMFVLCVYCLLCRQRTKLSKLSARCPLRTTGLVTLV
jgi:hypothetical protein